MNIRIFVTVFFCITALSSGLKADLGVQDPTRPIYEQPIDIAASGDGDIVEK